MIRIPSQSAIGIFGENKGVLNTEIVGRQAYFPMISEQYDSKIRHNNRCGPLFLFRRHFGEEVHFLGKTDSNEVVHQRIALCLDDNTDIAIGNGLL